MFCGTLCEVLQHAVPDYSAVLASCHIITLMTDWGLFLSRIRELEKLYSTACSACA